MLNNNTIGNNIITVNRIIMTYQGQERRQKQDWKEREQRSLAAPHGHRVVASNAIC